jgi:PEGA domain
VARCSSLEDFITGFARFTEQERVFIITSDPKPAGGPARPFIIQLADGSTALRGVGEITEQHLIPTGPEGKCGMWLRLIDLTASSREVHRQLMDAKSRLLAQVEARTAGATRPPPVSGADASEADSYDAKTAVDTELPPGVGEAPPASAPSRARISMPTLAGMPSLPPLPSPRVPRGGLSPSPEATPPPGPPPRPDATPPPAVRVPDIRRRRPGDGGEPAPAPAPASADAGREPPARPAGNGANGAAARPAAVPAIAKAVAPSVPPADPSRASTSLREELVAKARRLAGPPPNPEERAPGSPFQLPANPLAEIPDEALSYFVECTLYEQTDLPETEPPWDPSIHAGMPPGMAPGPMPGMAPGPMTPVPGTMHAPAPVPYMPTPVPRMPTPIPGMPVPPGLAGPMPPARSRRVLIGVAAGSVFAGILGGFLLFGPSGATPGKGSAHPGSGSATHGGSGSAAATGSGLVAGSGSASGSGSGSASGSGSGSGSASGSGSGSGSASGSGSGSAAAAAAGSGSADIDDHGSDTTDTAAGSGSAAVAAAGTHPAAPDAPCTATVTSRPVGARVHWGQAALGDTPLTDVAVPCGAAQVHFTHPRYAQLTRDLTAVAGEPTTLDVRMVRPIATLTLRSVPAGAHFKVNGQDAGKAPTTLRVPEHENIHVEAELAGFRTWRTTLRLREPTHRVFARMSRIR